jgi:hypothetical protein
MNLVFSAEIRGGKLIMGDLSRWKKAVESMSGLVEVALRTPRKDRSGQQNNFYWSVVVEILGKELGMTAQETHEALKIKFLSRTDKALLTVKSTTQLSTKEFMEYTEAIQRWAAEFLNINIPNPNEIEADI